MEQATVLSVALDDLSDVVAANATPTGGAGRVVVAVERFALTANNVTYAVHGDDFGYWRFWPAPAGRGIVPVWGFGRVVESHVDGIGEGERYYGYWPMASHAVIAASPGTRRGFDAIDAHRQGLAPVYNRYAHASDEWGDEALQCLFRPLFGTSFVLDAMLQDSPATVLLLSSASSKTALGLAQQAKGRQRVVGLTSPANRAMVEATGYYDQVLGYEQVGQVSGGPVAFVDFSGNGAVRHAVHNILGERLIESHVVGDTHWQAANVADLPGVTPQLFFAPTIMADRVAQWGASGYDARLLAAWRRFAGTLGWLHIVEASRAAAVARAWKAMVAGRIDPAEGVIGSL